MFADRDPLHREVRTPIADAIWRKICLTLYHVLSLEYGYVQDEAWQVFRDGFGTFGDSLSTNYWYHTSRVQNRLPGIIHYRFPQNTDGKKLELHCDIHSWFTIRKRKYSLGTIIYIYIVNSILLSWLSFIDPRPGLLWFSASASRPPAKNCFWSGGLGMSGWKAPPKKVLCQDKSWLNVRVRLVMHQHFGPNFTCSSSLFYLFQSQAMPLWGCLPSGHLT